MRWVEWGKHEAYAYPYNTQALGITWQRLQLGVSSLWSSLHNRMQFCEGRVTGVIDRHSSCCVPLLDGRASRSLQHQESCFAPRGNVRGACTAPESQPDLSMTCPLLSSLLCSGLPGFNMTTQELSFPQPFFCDFNGSQSLNEAGLAEACCLCLLSESASKTESWMQSRLASGCARNER